MFKFLRALWTLNLWTIWSKELNDSTKWMNICKGCLAKKDFLTFFSTQKSNADELRQDKWMSIFEFLKTASRRRREKKLFKRHFVDMSSKPQSKKIYLISLYKLHLFLFLLLEMASWAASPSYPCISVWELSSESWLIPQHFALENS